MEIGNKIIISYNNTKLISFIEDVLDDGSILIQAPYTYKNKILLNEKIKYNMVILTNIQIINAIVTIKDYIINGRREYYIINILQTFKQENQKRKYERFFCNLPYKIYLIDKYKEEQINVIIKDISLGGIRFLANVDIEKNVNIKINLNEEDFLASGEIVQTQYYPKANYKNQYRIKFDNVENGDLLKNYFKNTKMIN
ncbi:PilZ domain-containing protein [[Clostridium] colinum]|uniref:PilZ domain-containing protein n=1 Tax=[Clostridium] colinum TaxID=36835 RepID=UPI002024F258|nr:PilZ domain-containing protein [[Clostridium] colinum]